MDRVEVTFRASKSENKRLRAIAARTSVTVRKEKAMDAMSYGAQQNMLDLLEIYLELSRSVPLVQTHYAQQSGLVDPPN